jgi:hypothetical protein
MPRSPRGYLAVYAAGAVVIFVVSGAISGFDMNAVGAAVIVPLGAVLGGYINDRWRRKHGFGPLQPPPDDKADQGPSLH